MYLKPEELANFVRNTTDAEALIATLIERFGTEAAADRLTVEAKFSKQSPSEVARRTASNLLTSFTRRRFEASSW
jgi:hypothetical protein